MIRQEHITGVRVHGVKRNEKKRIGKKELSSSQLPMHILERLVLRLVLNKDISYIQVSSLRIMMI